MAFCQSPGFKNRLQENLARLFYVLGLQCSCIVLIQFIQTDFSALLTFQYDSMKLILAIPAIGLLCTGVLNVDKTNYLPAPGAHPSTPAAPVPVSELVSKIKSVPSGPVYKGESVELHFTAPNAPYLGVIDPDGKFFYVVFPAADAVGKLRPLVDSEKFVRINTLKISTATLKADPYTYGVYENQPVFTKSGTYRFICGENLHVDDEEALQVVLVHYKHVARPAIAFAN